MAKQRGNKDNEKVEGGIQREAFSIKREGVKISRNIGTISRNAPDFESLFAEDDNPLDGLPDTGDVQKNADQEMSAVEQEIERNRAASEERFRVAADPEFFFCVCFQSRDQKEEFLKNIGWLDELGDKYLNGLEVARRLEIPVTIIPLAPRKIRGGPQRFQKERVIGEGKSVKGGDFA
jgi:hypothetical protein